MTPLEVFGKELLDNLGNGPRRPFYHTEGKNPKPEECIDYGFICYRATENSKPNAPLEIDITIDAFQADQSLLDDLNVALESERQIFVLERKYLWVIDKDYELRILPERTQNPHTDRGYACHTNITGGNGARHGGELWYGKDSIVFINNSSGRFYTLSSEEWQTVVQVFIKAGYKKVVDIDLTKNTQPVVHE
jgi:hypothetical protein